MLFNYLTEAFHVKMNSAIYLSNIVTYFVYPINLSLRNIDTFREFETYKERWISWKCIWSIKSPPLSLCFFLFSPFLSLSLSLPHSLYPHCLFLSFTEGKKRANNGAHFHTGHKVKVSLHIVALYPPQEYLITFLDLTHQRWIRIRSKGYPRGEDNAKSS